MRKGEFFKKEGPKVVCQLCPHYCSIAPEKHGICGVRMNREGTLIPLTYGKVAALALDPIEKKPLYHFHPGREILSIGSIGCNLRCKFCQNWHLIEGATQLKDILIDDLVKETKRTGAIGIAYTYNEPLIQWEFVYDCAKAFHLEGLKNVLVTNGYVNTPPLEKLLEYIDALNIDLKFSRDDLYREVSGGSLEPVKKAIETSQGKAHVEVTTLLVTDLNDGEDEIGKIVDFIARLDPCIPIHISRYFPNYRFSAEETPLERMDLACKIAREKLLYVYPGNVHLGEKSNTLCPGCNTLLVERRGYNTVVRNLEGGRCTQCQRKSNILQ